MKIRSHVPNYCFDGEEPDPEIEFNSLDELMNIDFVKRWANNPMIQFHKYSISYRPSHYGITSHLLMAELKGGAEWWVIGYLSGEGIEKIGLPEWDSEMATKKKASYNDSNS